MRFFLLAYGSTRKISRKITHFNNDYQHGSHFSSLFSPVSVGSLAKQSGRTEVLFGPGPPLQTFLVGESIFAQINCLPIPEYNQPLRVIQPWRVVPIRSTSPATVAVAPLSYLLNMTGDFPPQCSTVVPP